VVLRATWRTEYCPSIHTLLPFAYVNSSETSESVVTVRNYTPTEESPHGITGISGGLLKKLQVFPVSCIQILIDLSINLLFSWLQS
jgi:hypothetical protein